MFSHVDETLYCSFLVIFQKDTKQKVIGINGPIKDFKEIKVE
jgi:hypothetical protein